MIVTKIIINNYTIIHLFANVIGDGTFDSQSRAFPEQPDSSKESLSNSQPNLFWSS